MKRHHWFQRRRFNVRRKHIANKTVKRAARPYEVVPNAPLRECRRRVRCVNEGWAKSFFTKDGNRVVEFAQLFVREFLLRFVVGRSQVRAHDKLMKKLRGED